MAWRRREPASPAERARLGRALLASTAAGIVVYVLVVHAGLPALAAWLPPEGREWLRRAFAEHPARVLAAIVAASALLALPVLGAFLWASGPRRRR